jgi:hypothetical protein
MKSFLILMTSFLVLACGAEESGCNGGNTATLSDGQGISFSDGCVHSSGNKKNSDLYVTFGEPYLKLTPGGDKPKVLPNGDEIKTQTDVLWTHPTKYGSLAEVPDTLPADGSSPSLSQVRTGYGFVIKNHTTSGYTKGWIETAEPNTGLITMHFEALVD